ncbi:DUF5986 family protein [Peribacillus sp. N1]
MSTVFIQSTEEFKTQLVQSVHYGSYYDYKEFIDSKKTTIKNGSPYNRMDFVYENLIQTFSDNRHITRPITSGNWQKHLQIIDTETKTLYVIAKDERVNTVRLNNEIDKSPHYFETYCLLNEKFGESLVFSILKENEYEQMSFPFGFSNKESELKVVGELYNRKKENLFKLIGQIDIECFVLIPILFKEDKLVDIRAHIPRMELADPYYYSEDWTKYIPVEFTESGNSNTDDTENNEIKIGIKKHILEKDSVELPLKKDKRNMDSKTE